MSAGVEDDASRIYPACLLRSGEWISISSPSSTQQDWFRATWMTFRVPTDYRNPAAGSLLLFGRSVEKIETRQIGTGTGPANDTSTQKPYLVYLRDWPGLSSPDIWTHPLTAVALDRGYQVLCLDYRGTGHFQLTPDQLFALGNPRRQANLLRLFRPDRIMRDLEAVRLCLTAEFDEDNKAWSLFGQSNGALVAISYLSWKPEVLREVFLMGDFGVIGRSADEVYAAAAMDLSFRNGLFYTMYPEDVHHMRRIAEHIDKSADRGRIPLPSRGKLTVQLFLSLGFAFSRPGGFEKVHDLVRRLISDLDGFDCLSMHSLFAFEYEFISLFPNLVSALLPEATYNYSNGMISNWAAHRRLLTIPNYGWVRNASFFLWSWGKDQPIYFSGEKMVFPFHLHTIPKLKPFLQAAEILALNWDWDDLYDLEQLKGNQVPVYAARCWDETYMSFGPSREPHRDDEELPNIGCLVECHCPPGMELEDVIRQLFKLRDANAMTDAEAEH